MTDVEFKEIPVTIEFSGGAETLFGNKKKYDVTLPANNKPWTINELVMWMKDNILTGDPSLFLRGNDVRPGIIVAINDTDWELLGCMNYIIQPKDNIFFISSLHGG